MNIKTFRNKLEQAKGRRSQVQSDLEMCTQTIRLKKRDLIRHERAREIIREVGLKTQENLSYHISDVVSLALLSVFPNPYELSVEFVQRRNKTECDLLLAKGEDKIEPMYATGGGVVDVLSFALRAACWAIRFPKFRNVLILDEPFRYLSVDLMPHAGQMLKEISEKLKLQIIMVSHEEELIESADRIFNVSKNKQGQSLVKLNDE